jgi:hypothetical protein
VFPKVKLVLQPDGKVDGNKSINAFFKNCIDKDSIYIRFDDDVVWMESDTIEKIARKRLEDNSSFIISPLVINNAVCTNILINQEKISGRPYVKAYAFDEVGWVSPYYASHLHNEFIKKIKNNKVDSMRVSDVPVATNRFSINCISWLGETFANFGGVVLGDEEEFLSCIKPIALGKSNLIVGDAIVAHFSFYTQRGYLDQTDILERYAEIVMNSNWINHDTFRKINEINKQIDQDARLSLNSEGARFDGLIVLRKFGSNIKKEIKKEIKKMLIEIAIKL